MLVCLAGDCHGQIDRLYEQVLQLEDQAGLGPVDLVVQVGDFGIWPDPTRLDKATLAHQGAGDFPRWYQECRAVPRTTVFIAGNHEDFDFLHARQSPDQREILPRLHFLPWGEVVTFHINGESLRIAGIGGCYAESNFRRQTLAGRGRKNYLLAELQQVAARRNPPIDLLVCHDAPAGTVREVACRGRGYAKTAQGEALAEVIALVQPRLTVTGHLHVRSERRVAGVRTIGLGIVSRHGLAFPGSLLLVDFPPAPAPPRDQAESGFAVPASFQEPEASNEPVRISWLADEFIEALAVQALRWAEQLVGQGRLDKQRERLLKDSLEECPYRWLLAKAIRHKGRPWLEAVPQSACWKEIQDRVHSGRLPVEQIVTDLERWEELVPDAEWLRRQLD